MVITLIILALSAFFFVNGKIRSDVVALCALVLLILCGILTPEEALSGFSNSIVIMMVGLKYGPPHHVQPPPHNPGGISKS